MAGSGRKGVSDPDWRSKKSAEWRNKGEEGKAQGQAVGLTPFPVAVGGA